MSAGAPLRGPDADPEEQFDLLPFKNALASLRQRIILFHQDIIGPMRIDNPVIDPKHDLRP